MPKLGRQYGPRSAGPVRSVNMRLPEEFVTELDRIAEENGRSLAGEVAQRLKSSFAPASDLRTLIREEIRAALAERDEANEDRCFGPRPEVVGRYRY